MIQCRRDGRSEFGGRGRVFRDCGGFPASDLGRDDAERMGARGGCERDDRFSEVQSCHRSTHVKREDLLLDGPVSWGILSTFEPTLQAVHDRLLKALVQSPAFRELQPFLVGPSDGTVRDGADGWSSQR